MKYRDTPDKGETINAQAEYHLNGSRGKFVVQASTVVDDAAEDPRGKVLGGAFYIS